MSNSKSQTSAVAARDAKVTEYETLRTEGKAGKSKQQVAGLLAGIARQIGNMDADLFVSGAEFTPWQRPTAVRSSGPQVSDTDLIANLSKLTESIARADKAGFGSVAENLSRRADALRAIAKDRDTLTVADDGTVSPVA